MKKIELKKRVVSVLTDKQMQSIDGGGTTSYTNCTGFACCSPKPCTITPTGASYLVTECGSPPAVTSGDDKCMCV